MMTKSRIGTTLLLLCILGLYGCDAGLDIDPTGSVTTDQYWQRDSDAVTAVNAVYLELDSNQMVKELDAITDIAYRALSGPGGLYDVQTGNVAASNNSITGIWDRYYRGIRRANDVITNVDNIQQVTDQDLVNRVENEARFLRAYFYTQLTTLWGDVPLILEPLEINEHVGRTARDEVVDFIINELDDIINSQGLPISYSGADIGRATLGAAQALKARVALRNERWTEARDASLAVIESGVYSLYPDYEGLFQYEGQNSNEIIFDRQYHREGQTYNAFSYSASSIGGNSTVEPIHHLYLMHRLDDDEFDLDELDSWEEAYDNLDPRWDHNVYYTGQPIGNSTYDSRPESPTADRVNLTETTSAHGYNVKKWIDYPNDSNNPGQGAINVILIRYADVLLMYAEASAELGMIDQSVYDAINEVRQRPTVDLDPLDETDLPDRDAIIDYLQEERAREFAFEGLRLYDMNRWQLGELRTGRVYGHVFERSNGELYLHSTNFDRGHRDHHYLWPIPQSEVNSNDEITGNNPGY